MCKNSKLGITISAVITKNWLQLPSRKSTTKPLLDATKVLPATLSDAIRAYWVALKARLHNREIKATIATVLQAAVKPSIITAAASSVTSGPVVAISENIRLEAAIAIPAVIKPL